MPEAGVVMLGLDAESDRSTGAKDAHPPTDIGCASLGLGHGDRSLSAPKRPAGTYWDTDLDRFVEPTDPDWSADRFVPMLHDAGLEET
jgi:hypothetical protein